MEAATTRTKPMATNQLSQVIRTLREATHPRDVERLTDGQLLECYLHSREEEAIAALVQRHGPMVWGVCRRVLRSHQDAEDAFQATFLVLVRKAASIVSRELVANWLYGVAHQTALKARGTAARRGSREKQVTAMPEPAAPPEAIWDDVQPLLDQELSRLPDKYRAVIALCDLEGKTRREVARQLHVPEGTVASRLATARTMLGRRLARRGVAVSGGVLAALLAEQVAAAGVPLSVATRTIKAATLFAAGQAASAGATSAGAVALAEGVLRTMLLTKLKIATAMLLAVAVLVTSTAALTHVLASPTDREGAAPAEPVPPAARQDPPPPGIAAVAQDQAPPTPAAKPPKDAEPVPAHVSGVVKAVDAQVKMLTVTHGDRDTTFNVAKDAEIEIDGKRGELGAVPAGASINLRQFTDARTARSVVAEGRWFWGVAKAVDAVAGTVTYGDRAQDGAAGKTFMVPKEAFVSIDGKAGKLTDIPAGASCNLHLCADQSTVRCLSAEGGQVHGVAKGVDAANRTITIGDTNYAVPQDAQIGIDHKPGKLEGVPTGANVIIDLRVDQKTVLRVSASGSSVFGTVKAVDTQRNTITVNGNPADRTFAVPPDTHIVIDGKPAALAGIPVGSELHALNLRVDQQSASGINVVGPGFHHVGVKAVDAAANTITIDDQAPAVVAGKTLMVATDAHIEIDGKPGKLAAIPAGAFVNLGLSVDCLTARNLQAEGPNLGGCGGSCVSAVNAADNTITFDEKGPADIAGKTFTLAPYAVIQIDGRPGKLAELPTGSYVNITLTVDRQTVRSLGAQGPRATGVVNAVDAANNTISVAGTAYSVAKDALVVIDGRTRTLAELQVGTEVHVNLRVDQRTIGMIQTKAP
jgi:RNA polymerase sigma factor (sigma-70 family)